MAFLILDLRGTFLFMPVPSKGSKDHARAEYTLDILRLGLMVVQGQPKTAAEYIQATSRIGRDHNRPGLVVVVLNLHKPRDRTHFEQFGHFHRSFYRAVEATSVTPWAARAMDRALMSRARQPLLLLGAARHWRRWWMDFWMPGSQRPTSRPPAATCSVTRIRKAHIGCFICRLLRRSQT